MPGVACLDMKSDILLLLSSISHMIVLIASLTVHSFLLCSSHTGIYAFSFSVSLSEATALNQSTAYTTTVNTMHTMDTLILGSEKFLTFELIR